MQPCDYCNECASVPSMRTKAKGRIEMKAVLQSDHRAHPSRPARGPHHARLQVVGFGRRRRKCVRHQSATITMPVDKH